MERHIWLDSGSIVTKKSPKPLKVSRVKHIYVKEHDLKTKVTRAVIIAAVLSFPFFLAYPIVGVAAFVVIGGISFLRTKKYELRVGIFNNDEVGIVESGLYSSNERVEMDDVVRQVLDLQSQQAESVS